MDSLYTKEVQQIITTADWPEELQWAVTEAPEGLWLIMYTGNYESLGHDDKITTYRIVNTIFPQIIKLGIPIGLKTKEGLQPAKGV